MTVFDKNCYDIKSNVVDFANSLENKNVTFTLGKILYHGRGKEQSCGESDECISTALRSLWSNGWQHRKIKRNTRVLSCGYGHFFTVSADGNVYGCPIIDENPTLGNVKNDSIKGIIDKLNYGSKRSSVENMSCYGTCELEYICAGNCRLKNYEATHDISKPSCSDKRKEAIYKTMINENLNLRSLYSVQKNL